MMSVFEDNDQGMLSNRYEQTYPIYREYQFKRGWTDREKHPRDYRKKTELFRSDLPKSATECTSSDMNYIHYYLSKQYSKDHGSHGGFFPVGWSIPCEKDMKTLLSRFNAISGQKPGGTVAAMFMNGGVLGLRLVNTGYLNAHTAWYVVPGSDFYDWVSPSRFTSVFAIYANKSNGSIDYDKSYNDSYRMYINAENGQAIVKTKDLQAYSKSGCDDNLRSPLGPLYPVVLCQRIN